MAGGDLLCRSRPVLVLGPDPVGLGSVNDSTREKGGKDASGDSRGFIEFTVPVSSPKP